VKRIVRRDGSGCCEDRCIELRDFLHLGQCGVEAGIDAGGLVLG
jgi:hypothetical protein